MELQIDNDALQEALRIITRLAPPADGGGNITIRSTGKKVYINSTTEGSRCEVQIPGDVSGKETEFAVSLVALRDATKGRAKLAITYDKTLCKIKSGGYKCELPTVDAMKAEDLDDKVTSSATVDQDQAKWLKQALSIVGLKPTALISTYMPLSIKLSKKGAFVACYDPNHMAFVNSNEITGSMEVRVPLDIFTSVLDAFDKSGFKMELSSANLYVSNKLVKVAMALPQEDEADLKLEEVIEAAKSSKSTEGHDIKIDKDEILRFLDNARAVATKERSEIKVTTEDKKMKLEVSTANGSIKAQVKVDTKKKIKALVDFEFFDEAIRKSGPQVDIKLVESEFMFFRLAKGQVLVSLNQE